MLPNLSQNLRAFRPFIYFVETRINCLEVQDRNDLRSLDVPVVLLAPLPRRSSTTDLEASIVRLSNGTANRCRSLASVAMPVQV